MPWRPNAEAAAAASSSPPFIGHQAASLVLVARTSSLRCASQLAHVKPHGAARTPKMSQPYPSSIQANIDSASSITILRTKPAMPI